MMGRKAARNMQSPNTTQSHPTPGSKRSLQLHKMYQSRCTAKNSWWWAERLPETCRFVIPIKLKFGVSVGFIHKESVTMHGHTFIKLIRRYFFWWCLCLISETGDWLQWLKLFLRFPSFHSMTGTAPPIRACKIPAVCNAVCYLLLCLTLVSMLISLIK